MVETLLFFLPGLSIYQLAKLLFIVWLVHPKFLGASFLHDLVLERAFNIIETTVIPHIRPILLKLPLGRAGTHAEEASDRRKTGDSSTTEQH